MIPRIIPFMVGIALLISGCAGRQDKQGVTDFTSGATLLKVAHLASPTADGSSLYITVDGKDAGLLPVGQAILLQVPAGDHKVGGYARSLIGQVTIPDISVTTSADSPRFVAYKVKQYDPLLTLRGIDPLPESAPIPEKQVAKSEPLPVPQITQLSAPESEAVPDTSKTVTSPVQQSSKPAPQEEATQKPASVDTSKTVMSPVQQSSKPAPQEEATQKPASADTSKTVTPPAQQGSKPAAQVDASQKPVSTDTSPALPPVVTDASPDTASAPDTTGAPASSVQ